MGNDWQKKILPPKPGSTGDTQGKRMPSGPSKKVRDDYLRKVKEIIRKNPPPSKKPGG